MFKAKKNLYRLDVNSVVLYIVQLHVYTLYIVGQEKIFFLYPSRFLAETTPSPNQKVNRMKKTILIMYVHTFRSPTRI